jgi:hypothetical protein
LYLLFPFRHMHDFNFSNHSGGRDAKLQIPSLRVFVPFFTHPSLDRTYIGRIMLVAWPRRSSVSTNSTALITTQLQAVRSVRSLSVEPVWPKRCVCVCVCVPNGNWIDDCKNEEIYFIFMISTTFHLYKWNTMGYSTISLSDLWPNIDLLSEECTMNCTALPFSQLVIRHELTWVSYFRSF